MNYFGVDWKRYEEPGEWVTHTDIILAWTPEIATQVVCRARQVPGNNVFVADAVVLVMSGCTLTPLVSVRSIADAPSSYNKFRCGCDGTGSRCPMHGNSIVGQV